MTGAVHQRIAGVAWDRLFHAYGTATDTPVHLRGLLGEDEQAISAASEHLWSAILHQGSVWPATAPAARIVATMLTRPALREGALAFLRQVAVATDLGDRADELRAVAYPEDPAARAAIDAWTSAYTAADEDDQVDMWDDSGTGDLVLTRAALDCYDAFPDLLAPVAEHLDDPDPAIRTAAWSAATVLARHPAAVPAAAGLRARLERLARAAGSAEERASLVLDLGDLGGEPRAWLADPHLVVRGAAALAPALADETEALDVLVTLAESPRAFDALSALPRFGGEPARWTLIAAVCARVTGLERLYSGALAALPRAFRLAPCPDLGPYLRVAFPDGWPTDPTPHQCALARAVGEREELWDPVNGNRKITFARLGLPDDRAAWRGLTRRHPETYSAADIVVMGGPQGMRAFATKFLGLGRTAPALPGRVAELLREGFGERSVTVEAGLRLTVEVPDGDLPTAPDPFTSPYPRHPFLALSVAAALSSSVRVLEWHEGRELVREYADLAATGPVRDAGPAGRRGFRVEFRLDEEWLPKGAGAVS
ncbi:hypothetical protein AB0J57_11295 [Streptomyces sp. NPDC049837]|uniref:hypothetical protein n=1 Tax=Streptomyces sp. NPDC049837 TaxID=3155277 RepID=UPI003444BCAA